MNTQTQTLNSNIIVGEYGTYDMVEYSPDIKKFEWTKAYVKGKYYYLFRGFKKKKSVLPGIYENVDGGHVIIEPTTDEEKEIYLVRTHIPNISPEDMINVLKKRPEETIVCNDMSNLFMPDISRNDDPLKRSLKEAFLLKGVNIDSCKERFNDRNALFNFKSVIKSDNKLSALLFERGCDALNLDYHIILTEKDNNVTIGKSLNDPEVMKRKDIIEHKYGIEPVPVDPDCGNITVSNIDKYILQGESA